MHSALGSHINLQISISVGGLVSGCRVLFPVSKFGTSIHKARFLRVISDHFFLLPSMANHLLLLVRYFLSNLLSLHHHCWLTYSTSMISQLDYLNSYPHSLFTPPPGSQGQTFKMEIRYMVLLGLQHIKECL